MLSILLKKSHEVKSHGFCWISIFGWLSVGLCGTITSHAVQFTSLFYVLYSNKARMFFTTRHVFVLDRIKCSNRHHHIVSLWLIIITGLFLFFLCLHITILLAFKCIIKLIIPFTKMFWYGNLILPGGLMTTAFHRFKL